MFGTLERLYRDIKEVQLHFGEVIAKKLADGRDSAMLSQDLSRIECEMPLTVTIEQMEYQGLVREGLKTGLEQLGFRSLIKRIFGEEEKKPKVPDNQMGLF